jgi:hypothetical protein
MLALIPDLISASVSVSVNVMVPDAILYSAPKYFLYSRTWYYNMMTKMYDASRGIIATPSKTKIKGFSVILKIK